ncbi:hypothetical protein F5050DRAFT_1813730 [Lentinula boryana]|uniref:Uncharacterized protein n=1 Tax=Lentinula boryana TaxID=40481 RepID=A0ABQ8PX28_9AGAR|nr:hypothetical protein F5050DRAFT_1813730 [Lentinula boryana]
MRIPLIHDDSQQSGALSSTETFSQSDMLSSTITTLTQKHGRERSWILVAGISVSANASGFAQIYHYYSNAPAMNGRTHVARVQERGASKSVLVVEDRLLNEKGIRGDNARYIAIYFIWLLMQVFLKRFLR